jgi:hypothetical protein
MVRGLACCIVLASIDFIVREEGSCNLSRREDPLLDLEPIYAFAISAGEATWSCREAWADVRPGMRTEEQHISTEYKASETPVRIKY